MAKTLLTPLPLRLSIFIVVFVFISQSSISESRERHVITFRSPTLYPEGLTWDPTSNHFIVASVRHGTFHTVTNNGVIQTLTSSASNLPYNPIVLGLAFDTRRNRLIAAFNTVNTPYVAAFSLHRTSNSLTLLFLTHLPTDSPSSAASNDVALDPHGNAYVTNFGENLIWKVSLNGTASVLSLDRTSPYSYAGLNGVVYLDGKELLLVVQSNTGKLLRVDAVNGKMSSVALPKEVELTSAHGIAVREDGVVFVVSTSEVWVLKSEDRWGRGELIDRITLESEGFPSSVSVGNKGRVYLLYGFAEEGMTGKSKGQEREWFRIEEVGSNEESEAQSLWPFLMIALALLYFLFWRFQMTRFVNNLDKKHS
ncbi:uncharacterized protein LOC141651885 [Silene latifolia]|uniref:uncharacterized protein LOC141651885 n=1 Tax=Silene latifolia TaxID=37657 RepID=UPI003D77EEC7